MINYDLIEGLRIALAKGYTLEQAMMSFYNAGYPKKDIEEAARVLLYHPSQTLTHPEKPIPEHIKKPAKALPSQKPSKPLEGTPRTISVYDEAAKTRTKATISVLILVLFVLLIALGGIIIFKDALINFFANLF